MPFNPSGLAYAPAPTSVASGYSCRFSATSPEAQSAAEGLREAVLGAAGRVAERTTALPPAAAWNSSRRSSSSPT
jgi:hypothetical protein